MSETLTQTLARNPILAIAVAPDDALPFLDVSASGLLKDGMITVAEMRKALQRFIAPLIAFGQLEDEASYGYFKPRIACKIVGIDYNLGDLPVGSSLSFDLTKGGTEQSVVTTIGPSDDQFGQVIFPTALTLAAADVIRLKVKSVGSGSPGAFLQANLIIEPISP